MTWSENFEIPPDFQQLVFERVNLHLEARFILTRHRKYKLDMPYRLANQFLIAEIVPLSTLVWFIDN